ncbi:MAG: hypothetical protein NAOJABEB_03179 [Steroidobacteraceae bacterium]|nr:hypothetical protein [Steroidobacteraceae bacterium]
MYVLERARERRQLQRGEHAGRQPVAHAGRVQLAERLADERAQARLRDALGRRVDRRQRFLERRAFGGDVAILRVHDLEAEWPASHFAVTAQAAASRKARLLARREVEEAQRHVARAVCEPREQLSAAAEGHLGQLHLALDHRAHAGRERADRYRARAVLVRAGQHEEQVLHLRDAEVAQALAERRPDPTQRGDRALLGRGQPRCSTHSTSTRAPFGSCATPIAARAG